MSKCRFPKNRRIRRRQTTFIALADQNNFTRELLRKRRKCIALIQTTFKKFGLPYFVTTRSDKSAKEDCIVFFFGKFESIIKRITDYALSI